MGEKYIHELCRLCMYKSGNMFDIFGVNGRHGYLAAEVIQDLLQIEVGLSDGFPRYVCSVCLDKLTDFKLFKDQCLESRSSFEQEFGHIIALAVRRKVGGAEVNQDPLVCSSSIKEEVEIVEIPAETEIFKDDDDDLEEEDDDDELRGSPPRSEAFDLDVVTIDDEDNVLCLGSKDELERPPSPSAPPKDNVRNSRTRKRNKLGQFVKGKKKTKARRGKLSVSSRNKGSADAKKSTAATKLEGLMLKLQTLEHSEDSMTTGTHEGQGGGKENAQASAMEHPLWLDSDGDFVTQESDDQAVGENARPMRHTKRKRSGAQESAAWPSEVDAGEQGSALLEGGSPKQPKLGAQGSDLYLGPEYLRVSRPEERLSGDATQGRPTTTSASCDPLFVSGGDKALEPQWRAKRRVAASARMYTEDSILLSSGNTPQGFVDWGFLGLETTNKTKRKRKKKIPSHKVAQGSGNAQGSGDAQGSGAFAQDTGGEATEAVDVVAAAKTDGSESVTSLNGDAQAGENGVKKTFRCSTCDMRLPSRTKYLSHRKTHKTMSGQGSFPCPQCGKLFKASQSMKRHQIVHTGLRPFACNLCDLAYTRVDLLKRHMGTHKV